MVVASMAAVIMDADTTGAASTGGLVSVAADAALKDAAALTAASEVVIVASMAVADSAAARVGSMEAGLMVAVDSTVEVPTEGLVDPTAVAVLTEAVHMEGDTGNPPELAIEN
jgi:hypothetical protein